jgi:hypothetical protein
MTQETLFPNEIKPLNKNLKLVISTSKNKKLSKEQIVFNKFSKKIEDLRKRLVTDELKFNKLVNYFSSKVLPLQVAHSNELINFSKALFAIHTNEKLSKSNKEKLKKLILSNLEEAFQHVIPTDEVKAIYDAFSPISFDEEQEEQLFFMKEMMEDMFKSSFGMDVDFSDMNMNEEDIAKKMAELKEQHENQQREQQNKEQNRKKTKKEIELELQQKQTIELQKKNIRGVYMSLAKILHPDLETDEKLKLEKQELMKKVTVAYQEKDLHTLLKLEIEIIHQQSKNLDHLTDEKLRILNSALREQVMELEDELEMMEEHPRYQNIIDYIHLPENFALRNMNALVDELTFSKNDIAKDTEELMGQNKMNFINDILKNLNTKQSKNFDDLSPQELMELMDFMGDLSGLGKKGSNKTKSKKKR